MTAIRSVVALAVLAVAGSACAAATPTSTPQIVYVTPAPTVRATPEPTLQPTPDPTPEPVQQTSGYLPYLTHVGDVANRFVTVLEAVGAAASATDVPGLSAAGSDMVSLANGEIAWLDSHPPDPCFADAQATFRTAVQDFADAGRYIVAGADTLDVPTLQLGIDSMTAGDAAITEATAAIDAALC